jgi:hypothetical protein
VGAVPRIKGTREPKWRRCHANKGAGAFATITACGSLLVRKQAAACQRDRPPLSRLRHAKPGGLPIELRPKREAPCLGGFAAENVSNRAIHHPRDFRLARESRARTSAERFTFFINVSRAPQPARCCRCRPADVRSSRLSREVLRARVVVADLGAVMYSALRCSRKTTAGPDEVREPTPNQSNAQRRRSPNALRPTHRNSPTQLTSTALQVIQRQQLGEYGRG